MESIPGGPPSLAALPSGCSFHPRCRFARDDCTGVEPPLAPVAQGEGSDVGHDVACYHYDEVHLDRTGRASVADLAKVLGAETISPSAAHRERDGGTT
jgi:hypothetical protein